MDGGTETPRGRIPRPLTCATGLSDRSRSRDLLAPPSPLSPRRRARSVPIHSPREPIRRCHSPETRKRVRFADSLGLELISVRHYSQSHDPDSESDSEGGELMIHATPTLSPPPTGKKPSWWSECAVLQFQPPVTRPDFDVLLRCQRVCVESVSPGPVCVTGTVRVQNLSFHKQVLIRYTFDRWASHSQVTGAYLPPTVQHFSLSTDRFQFRLPLPAPPCSPLALPPSLEFAVCYCVQGEEFWDSNEGQNYAICWTDCPPAPPQQDTAWIHFI
ncbi:protein phosphatase 1 regulatory subunit 3E [Amia ocellicauda]|uniref:protein phosphatase 1 regulatory subunit 3E n=1 Tax=Amia ocellicauda TaxID=2972642 RepID=UPI0034642237